MSPKRVLSLVDDPERRQMLEEFIDCSVPFVQVAVLEAFQSLVQEVNSQLLPAASVSLVDQSGRISVELVSHNWTVVVTNTPGVCAEGISGA